MKKGLNICLLVLKFPLFFTAFVLTLIIMFNMYDRVDKSILEGIYIFIPYILVLIFFVINLYQKEIRDNTFYNLTSCLVFIVTIVVALRALYDKNMLLNEIMGYNINFSYFSDYISFMNIFMYGLVISSVLFMIGRKRDIVSEDSKIELL